MNAGIGITALIFTAVLGGMRIAYGVDIWKGSDMPFYRVWNGKTVYLGSCVWLMALAGIWFLSSHGRNGICLENRYLQSVRCADLLATYVLLAFIDAKRRVVSDRILVCAFLGQMLLGGVCGTPAVLLSCLIAGSIFAGLMISFAWLSKGKFGMGDAKLLGVTAMTAGVPYTIQLVCAGLLTSFLYGLWLLLFKRKNVKAEFPFVPFLALGMVMNIIYFAV